MTLPQLPLLDAPISTGVDALSAVRPQARKHTVTGEYGKLFAGWRAQIALVLAFVSSEIQASRLPLATDRALLELLSSEFLATIVPAPTAAIGEVYMERSLIDDSSSGVGTFSPGVIKKGTRFVKRANATATPPVTAAEYESIEAVYCDEDADLTTNAGSGWLHRQLVTVKVRAKRSGTSGNALVFRNAPGVPIPIVLSDTLFDASTTTTGYTKFFAYNSAAAGGLDGQSDEELRSLGKALAVGQFAPTEAAALAGALGENGIVRAVPRRDLERAIQLVAIADRSWCASAALTDKATQAIRDKWQGFGCRVQLEQVENVLIAIKASIVLSDPKYAADTFDIREAVRKALLGYFDGRPDFYMWRSASIKAIVAQADPRILTCTSVTVCDGFTGLAIGEPNGFTRYHYYLAESGVTLTIASPS